ncbi:PREDICTED: kelch-like protein 24 [Branchiostoma belcheri]|uniref:Kelch-like protein 24 n=1 Tax=Branchiostoma belcheri TaxID=7741 RepID=A0A6P4Z083_BRABE|nr:PREDICTED: kelch-like protein 24 [Branchiostoma belcheri]
MFRFRVRRDSDAYGYDDYDESDREYPYEYDSDICYVNRRRDRRSKEDGSRRFKNYYQGRELLAEFASQREAGAFLDVVVQVESREFPCHRAVLASTPYFKTMLSSNLSESSSRVIQLREIDSISFSKILDFLYTGKICIGKDDVQDILKTAHMLQFDRIVQYCHTFIQDNLCLSNCLGVMSLADMYGLSVLKTKARDMAVSNFPDVTQEEEFRSLSVQELADILGDERLKVTNEDDVVQSVLRWLDHVPENSKTGILKILQKINLSCVRISVLQKLESHPVIRESAECLAKITAAKVEGEDAGVPRLGISDNLAIISAAKKPRLYNVHPIIAEPTSVQRIICLDPDSEQYYHITTLPTSVSGYMSVASAGRQLYVTGGRVHPLVGQGPHSAPSRQAFRYDFPSDTWLRLPDMPRGRAGHRSVVVDGKLFVVGGDAEATSLLTMDCYDPVKGAWIQIRVRPPLRTSSILTVTAFRDKIVFIEIHRDDRPITVNFGFALLFGATMGDYGLSEKLCVHAFGVKTKDWRYTDIQFDIRGLVRVEIIATAANDKLYIRTGCTPYANVYVFDAEGENLNKGDRRDVKEKFFRAHTEHSYHYMTGQEGIVDIIRNYDFGADDFMAATRLPFALFGHSFLETKKSRLGWYFRDLAALEKEDEREGSDSELNGATSSSDYE